MLSSTHPPLNPTRLAVTLTGLAVLLACVTFLALCLGSVSISVADVARVLAGISSDGTLRTIVLDIRLPRVLLAMLVGAGLAIAGATFQALLRNPLAEPFILGISSGGTVGALLAIGLGLAALSITTPLMSFLGSASVMLLVYGLAHRRGYLDTYSLLLSGVMIGAFFNAAILMLVAVFNQELRNAFLWLMGNLGAANLQSIAIITGPLLIACGLLIRQSRNFNLIATGDEQAMQLGVEVAKVKRLSYLLASLITGLVVSVSGVVGFVGLLIPHICRILFGPDHRILLPSSILLGGAFLILTDLLARTLLSPTEIPVGAVTAVIGAPIFIYLLRKT